MKRQPVILLAVVGVLIAVIIVDGIYSSQLEKRFLALEKKRMVISNQLATAKIVYKNLNHVRDLVLQNMDFEEQKSDNASQETHFFEFVTTCVNDLKLTLISVKPSAPVTTDRVTVFGYEMVFEGDFFKFGELCSKLENSRRIISIESFKVELIAGDGELMGTQAKGVRVRMMVNTYRVKKV